MNIYDQLAEQALRNLVTGGVFVILGLFVVRMAASATSAELRLARHGITITGRIVDIRRTWKRRRPPGASQSSKPR
ncbi:hypothetical protein ACFOVU_16630 [Nocardiopsis sediminis]|uniref:Uncharacterized protein n=1 Tax=Nocardiopsis sediminis TaxID=1778267 RepID=A0ABV8FSJ8_9ACTN